MALELRSDLIGGGVVRRRFSAGGKEFHGSHILTGDEVRAFRNHREMIRNGMIDIWPAAVGGSGPTSRFIVGLGKDKYDVIEGRKLNDSPLSKAEASALAHPEDAPQTQPEREKEPA